MAKLSSQQIADLKEVFGLLDYDKDGKVFSRDISAVIRAVGLKPAEFEIKDMVNEVDQTYGGTVDLQTLVTMISRKVSDPESSRPQDMVELFRMFDKNGSGMISSRDLKHLLTTVGERLTDDEADELIKQSKTERSGMVNYTEFVQRVMSS